MMTWWFVINQELEAVDRWRCKGPPIFEIISKTYSILDDNETNIKLEFKKPKNETALYSLHAFKTMDDLYNFIENLEY